MTHVITRILAIGLLFISTYATANRTCNDNIVDQWPDSRYLNHDDGTITDLDTGLMWKHCSEGQSGTECSGLANTYHWKAALELAQNESFAGYSDWRLPNIRELTTLVAFNCYNMAINTTYFPNTPGQSSNTWSSSPYVISSGVQNLSYTMNFSSGNISLPSRNTSQHVRLVRGTQ